MTGLISDPKKQICPYVDDDRTCGSIVDGIGCQKYIILKGQNDAGEDVNTEGCSELVSLQLLLDVNRRVEALESTMASTREVVQRTRAVLGTGIARGLGTVIDKIDNAEPKPKPKIH